MLARFLVDMLIVALHQLRLGCVVTLGVSNFLVAASIASGV